MIMNSSKTRCHCAACVSVLSFVELHNTKLNISTFRNKCIQLPASADNVALPASFAPTPRVVSLLSSAVFMV